MSRTGYMATVIALALLPFNHAATCDAYAEPERIAATPEGNGVDESSGLAPSFTRPGVWFTHNDAGGEARLYAFTLDGEDRGAHDVLGVPFQDWEALSAGPCPATVEGPEGRCLYIGDIGDNGRSREDIQVFIVPEPQADEETLTARGWNLRYPDGARDAETLFISPISGQLGIVTKDADGLSEIYVLDAPPASGQTATLRLLANLGIVAEEGRSRRTTGGDIDPEGQRVVVRSYGQLLLWDRDPCAPYAHWARLPDLTLAAPEDETQGEAVAFDPRTGDLITSSEGDPMELFRYACEGLRIEATECPGDTGGPGDSGDTGDTASADDSDPPDSEPPDSEPPDSGPPDSDPSAADSDPGSGPLQVQPGRDCGCAGARAALLLPLLLLGLGRRRAQPRP
ncbi:MAG: hypothetical protein H6741_23520 [Alphaproteobacteria bacterium]|nr:hypothetical protein [Alphaproteobacteria bacterium]MCB9795677.1 hypothetical protein [Alphaproteobacteria bacterium]